MAVAAAESLIPRADGLLAVTCDPIAIQGSIACIR